MAERDERTARYRYDGPADQFAPYAGAEFVYRGDVLELTDRQAAIAMAYGNQITLLRDEPEDEPVADQEEVAEEPATDDENDDAAEAPSRTRRRR